jgi:hypothetical protein
MSFEDGSVIPYFRLFQGLRHNFLCCRSDQVALKQPALGLNDPARGLKFCFIDFKSV